ncbi:MAG: hypothetical protein ABL927_12145 [Bdellovibrionales bacterium]
MAKKIKYGNVDIPDESFDDSNAVANIYIRLPLLLVKELRRLSLTEEHGGKYQVLIRDILTHWVEHQKPKKKRA